MTQPLERNTLGAALSHTLEATLVNRIPEVRRMDKVLEFLDMHMSRFTNAEPSNDAATRTIGQIAEVTPGVHMRWCVNFSILEDITVHVLATRDRTQLAELRYRASVHRWSFMLFSGFHLNTGRSSFDETPLNDVAIQQILNDIYNSVQPRHSDIPSE
ncbi:hypothetical protein KBC59_03195 [Patescibacteria group bacterium]|nr:hypothetical protein [Patescibacteria group bacterium]